MINKEEIEKAKEVDIRIILEKFIIPYKEDGNRVIFKIRENDDTPSVSAIQRNGIWLWKDFGKPDLKGTVIELYQYLSKAPFPKVIEELLSLRSIETKDKEDKKLSIANQKEKKNIEQEVKKQTTKIEIIAEYQWFLDKQKEYLQKRCVWPTPDELRNIKYKVKDKIWYGVGIKMMNGHYAIRQTLENATIRYIYTGTPDISFWNRESDKIIVVEGMFDAMSVEKLEKQNTFSILILNSVVNIKKAIEFLENRKEEIWLALDNDEAGIEASKMLYEVLENVNYYHYDGKDLNDFLINKKQQKDMINQDISM